MNRIRLLSEQVANQIAAGEVVERPASVVKELVENAIDAQATRITVETHSGGRSLIRVTDDGTGMNRDDALLSLERHATSKIREASDLFHIGTMGFRGEALPSIASVSRFTLMTRDNDTPEATQIIINGGKIAEVKTAGSPVGTSIEVRQLFYNIPARRKFLRTEETERSHIQHYLTLAALSHPGIAFILTQNGRITLQLPAVKHANQSDRLRERLRALQGGQLKLLAVDHSGHYEARVQHREDAQLTVETELKDIRVWGFIGAPGVSRGNRGDQNLFVNQRPIENRGLNAALFEGYHTSLMKGRYPVCCLFLELDPAEVDVNIHPAKREIKFHRERQVRQFVAEAIRDTLLRFHADAIITTPPGHSDDQRSIAIPTSLDGSPASSDALQSQPVPQADDEFALDSSTVPDWPAARQNALPLGFSSREESEQMSSLPVPIPQPSPPPLLAIPLKLVGVIGRLYVVLESDRGMVLMDQHAAHERVLFEKMLERMESGHTPSQRLLLPETIELSARDAEFLKRHLDTLNRLGIELSEFGETTFLLEALPPFVKTGDPRQFATNIVDTLKASGLAVNSMRLGEDMVAKTVCRHAVKANDSLNGPELENLVNDLRRCRMPYTCPHGRPTLIEFSMGELEKKFGRVQ